VVIGYLVFRRMTRDDTTTADRGIGAFAGEV
jgi:spermidine/putrescine transport system permease protein